MIKLPAVGREKTSTEIVMHDLAEAEREVAEHVNG
jgi:hypothetical protein